MSKPEIKPGEMEDIIPEEVSAVETPAVPEAGFVVLNKSETPEPEPTPEVPVLSEVFPLSADEAVPLEILEATVASDVADVIAKSLVDLKFHIEHLSEIQKGQLLDLAIAVAPESEQINKSDEGDAKIGEQVARILGLLEQLMQKQATPMPVETLVLSDEEILAKAEEIAVRKSTEAKASVVNRKRDSQIEELAGQVARLRQILGRACGQDT